MASSFRQFSTRLSGMTISTRLARREWKRPRRKQAIWTREGSRWVRQSSTSETATPVAACPRPLTPPAKQISASSRPIPLPQPFALLPVPIADCLLPCMRVKAHHHHPHHLFASLLLPPPSAGAPPPPTPRCWQRRRASPSIPGPSCRGPCHRPGCHHPCARCGCSRARQRPPAGIRTVPRRRPTADSSHQATRSHTGSWKSISGAPSSAV